MLLKLGNIGRRVWRGAWQPLYPLNPRKWLWHYIEYAAFRAQDVISALYIFMFPIAIGFFVYEHFAANPKGVAAVLALLTVLWACLVSFAYHKGR